MVTRSVNLNSYEPPPIAREIFGISFQKRAVPFVNSFSGTSHADHPTSLLLLSLAFSTSGLEANTRPTE